MLGISFPAVSRALLGLAVLLLAWVAARSTWLLLQPAPVLPVLTETRVELSVVADNPATRIRQASLFGQPVTQAVSAPAPRRKPSARLDQLTLLGLLAAGDGSGSAVIEIKDDRQGGKVYRPGDQLPDVGQVLAVWSDHVVLRVAGLRERLYLQAPDQTESVASLAPSASVPADPSLARFRDTLKSNPAKLRKHFVTRPVRRNGKLLGYSVRSQGAYRELFEQMGLRDGDVITEINGMSLTDAGSALRAYQQLRDADQLSARILRGGRNVNIRHSLN